MKADEFLKYIENPKSLTKSHVEELKTLTQDFPYFQPARLLYSLATHKFDTSLYLKELKKTSISINNRNHFYKLIKDADTSEVSELKTIESGQQVKNSENEKSDLKISQPERGETKKVEEVFDIADEIRKQTVVSAMDMEIINVSKIINSEIEVKPQNFSEWLIYLNRKNANDEIQDRPFIDKQDKKPVGEKKSKQKKNLDLINRIIESNPGNIKLKEEPKFFSPDIKAKESLLENEDIVTETLAKIYAQQGNINKAIRAYEILNLRFPQKSAYFAAQIQKLKSN